jgi:hypothetical protein
MEIYKKKSFPVDNEVIGSCEALERLVHNPGSRNVDDTDIE